MQRVTVVRYTTKPERADENEALSRAVFAQLRERGPEQLAYAVLRDRNQFTHVFLNLRADESADLTELPTFKRFQEDIMNRCEQPPQVTRVAATLLECYGIEPSTPRVHDA